MSPEEKAELARDNGAKSHGPVTPEGKLRSARNSIVHGRRAYALKFFIPPHSACAANESRQQFYDLLDQLVEHYRPLDATNYNTVREIAIATWQIHRHTLSQTALFNRELFGESDDADLDGTLLATEKLIGPTRTVAQLTREIDRLHRRIYQLERRFYFNRVKFPSKNNTVVKLAKLERESRLHDERTDQIHSQSIENKQNEPENEESNLAA